MIFTLFLGNSKAMFSFQTSKDMFTSKTWMKKDDHSSGVNINKLVVRVLSSLAKQIGLQEKLFESLTQIKRVQKKPIFCLFIILLVALTTEFVPATGLLIKIKDEEGGGLS